jgi:disulfide bond formation protein DsbB
MQFVILFNLVVASAVATVQVFTVAFLLCLFSPYKPAWMQSTITFVTTYALHLALFVAASGTILTFVYYYGLGYVPCDLAWYQHVSLYPLVILLALCLWCKEPLSMRFALVLSSAGLALSCFHVLIEYGFVDPGVVGGAVSCAAIDVMAFGYLTIPLMAFSGFLPITILLYLARQSE